MRKLTVLFFILILSSCSFFESDYEKIIKDVRASKLNEMKQGIPNPVFDGIVEPNFPDEEENYKTFEGVDSNKDGIRDDIEIWINRTSEDKEIRIAMKHYYKIHMRFIMGVISGSSVSINTQNHLPVGLALFCLSKAYGKKRIEYRASKSRTIEFDTSDELEELIFNTKLRKDEYDKIKYVKLNLETFNKEEVYDFCSKENNLEYLKKEW